MVNIEYPEPCRTADEIASRSQRAHFRLLIIESGLAVATVILGSMLFLRTEQVTGSAHDLVNMILVGMLSLFLAILLVLVWTRERGGHAHRWFVARKLSESVKSETWRFVIGVDEYVSTPDEAWGAFILSLEQDKQELGLPSETRESSAAPTESMRKLRVLSTEERLELYTKNRLEDQIDWYTGRSTKFARLARRWDMATYGFQGFAIFLPIMHIVLASGIVIPVDLVGIVVAVAVTCRSWSNARHYRELAETYRQASTDLVSLRQEVGRLAPEEEKLHAMVSEVERAVSREHRQWVVRRTPEAGRPGR